MGKQTGDDKKREKRGQAQFVAWMGPLLDALRELGDSATPQEVTELVAKACRVPDAKREELTATGVPKFYNQVAWARQYLVWEGLLSAETRGVWSLTPKGRQTRLSPEQSREVFRKWVAINAERRREREAASDHEDVEEVESSAETTSPDDVAEEAGLLSVLRKLTPSGFESFCKHLLGRYGFENVTVTSMGKDGGIDGYGVLQLNPFVSFRVIFQCKRYSGSVSRAQVGDFRNAMLGRAEKGILITTGTFSRDARAEATREGAPPVELIDGLLLVKLLQDKRIGVIPREAFDVDYAFFEPYLPGK